MAKRKAGMELLHVTRRGQVTLGSGRNGGVTLSGRATFTREEFEQWLARATWYVNAVKETGTASEHEKSDMPLQS